MRAINGIVFHCSATKPDVYVDVPMIRGWHLQRGFKDIGYHLVILRNGIIQQGRPLDQAGAHVKGHNNGNIGVCIIGGGDAKRVDHDFYELYTSDQYEACRQVVQSMRTLFGHQELTGHNDYTDQKLCPGFKVERYATDWSTYRHD